MGRRPKLSAFEEGRERRLQQDRDLYAAHRAARHPWLTIAQAAHELGLAESRISQLITEGKLTPKPNSPSRRVAAVDVYAYKPRRKL